MHEKGYLTDAEDKNKFCKAPSPAVLSGRKET